MAQNISVDYAYGCELVPRTNDDMGRLFAPEKLQEGLGTIIEIGRSRLHTFSIRLFGMMATSDNWTRYLEACRNASKSTPNWSGRVKLWHDQRRFLDREDDIITTMTDARAGKDVWSEARPLETM